MGNFLAGIGARFMACPVAGERYFSNCRQSLDEIDRVEVELEATRTDPGDRCGSACRRCLADAHSLLPFDMTLKGEKVDFLAQRGIWPSGLATFPIRPD